MNLFHERDVFVEQESIPDLIKDLRDEVMVMIRQQIELARTETTEKISNVTKNVTNLAIGGFVLYAGFLFLLLGVSLLGYVGLLLAGMSPAVAIWLMPLIVGVIVAVVGGIMVNNALRTFRKTSVVPEKTVNSIREDQKWIKQKVQ